MMEISTSTSLCKGIRACGLPKEQSYQILNTVLKWTKCNGPEWTVARLKDLRQWYETTIAGDPKPPVWHRKNSRNLPTGIWGWLFKQPTGKVLGILSCTTVFREKEPSLVQLTKFQHGLDGNGSKPVQPSSHRLYNLGGSNPLQVYRPIDELEDERGRWIKFSQIPVYAQHNVSKRAVKALTDIPTIPSVADITGNSIPVDGGRTCLHPKTITEKVEALRLSWADIPQPLVEFLAREQSLDQIPINVLGNEYQLELDRERTHIAGRIGCIQGPELKARWIANPNRVVQHYLRPLQNLYMETLRSLHTDCTHCQEEGVAWVQKQLQEGRRLSGSDLTSASDLLNRYSSILLVDQLYGFDRLEGYSSHRRLFLEICELDWHNPYTKEGRSTWKQGQPLGTAPSFGLLGLTNNAAAFLAAEQEGLDPDDAFRVIGDDIIMDSRMLDSYNKIIASLGGEINHSKTLTSSHAAEFAGRVITPKSSYLKKVNYVEPSDMSFMAIMAQLGPQASYLLRPRQRQAFEKFRYVPGIVVEGPWLKDSFGEPFATRYRWYLDSPLCEEKLDPDRRTVTQEQTLLEWQLHGHTTREGELELPFPLEESYLDSEIPDNLGLQGDPRRVDGLSTLEVLEKVSSKETFEPYRHYKERTLSDQPHSEEILDEAPAPKPETSVSVSKPTKPRRRLRPSYLFNKGKDEPDGPEL